MALSKPNTKWDPRACDPGNTRRASSRNPECARTRCYMGQLDMVSRMTLQARLRRALTEAMKSRELSPGRRSDQHSPPSTTLAQLISSPIRKVADPNGLQVECAASEQPRSRDGNSVKSKRPTSFGLR